MQSLDEHLLDDRDVPNRRNLRLLKNIVLLAVAWALTLTTSTLLTTVGPLSAVELGASNSLAAFAIGVFLLGAAISSVPSAHLFAVYGRFYGFSVGCICQMLGSAFGAVALYFRWLSFVYIGCFFIGLGQGLGQFYRFSAVEISPPELKSSAITYVLSGGVIAAFMGPICANNTARLDSNHEYLGSYAIVAVIGILNEITIFFVDFPKPSIKIKDVKFADFTENNSQMRPLETRSSETQSLLYKTRKLKDIVRQPLFMLSCFVATMAHTFMVMLMSDVTLAMSDYGYSFNVTSIVMELHFFSMFGPGFFSGKLIMEYGSFSIALVGGIISGASSAVFLIGTEAWNFYLGMVLLGIGWNFSFSAGTVMLTDCYLPHEATRVQAVNDFILFTVAGIGSLAAGFLYTAYGWQVTVLVTLVLSMANLIVFAVTYCLKRKEKAQNIDDIEKSPSRASLIDKSNIVEDEEDQDDVSRKSKASDFRSALSFDGMNETNMLNTIRSFSAA